VARLCSVFEVPRAACSGRGAAFDPVGGMQNDAGQLTRALDRRGVAQTIITAYRPGAPRREHIGDHATVFRVGLPVRRLRQLYSVPASVRLPLYARAADLVHAHLAEDLAVVPLALAAARLNRLPLVLTIHTSLTHTLTVTNPRSGLLKILGGAMERLGQRHAVAIIALTPRTGELLVERGIPADRVHVIPPGVDAARFRPPLPDLLHDIPRPRAVFIGRLCAQKAVATLIMAIQQLPPNVHVVLVGDGPQRASLEALTAGLGLRDRTHFRGFVPPQDVPAVLAGADVFVLPSRYEELGSVLLEAMAAGVPIVASSTGGVPDVVRDGVTGLLVPPGDPGALASAVRAVLDDPGLADRLRAGARATAHQHDSDTLADRVLHLYGRIARPSPG
jgi:glycosyltransferase involved in cell wall biosynthesis